MQAAVASPLTAWENFYVIIGSAAAGLTGLMFVVITLIAGTRVRRSDRTVAAFGTPTVVHFCVALLIAAGLSAPWPALWNAALLLGIAGLGGIVYVFIIAQRARHQSDYIPVLEDWLWHTVFPLIAYIALFIAALLLSTSTSPALFCVGAVTLLLLFIGIHNAWDTVTYIVADPSLTENQGQD